MATDLIRYVDPDATGAGNGTSWADAYTGLAAALTAEIKDLQASDERMIFECRSSAGTADTVGSPDIGSGWNTALGTDNYVLIRPGAGHEATPLWSTSKYRLATQTIGTVFRDVIIENIQIELARVAASQIFFDFRSGGSGYREVKRCHIKYTGSGGSSNTFAFPGGDVDLRISNNIFDGFPQNCIGTARSGGSYHYTDNTLVNCVTGFGNTGTQLPVARGNLFYNVTNPLSGTWDAATDYNATDQASLGITANTNDRVSQTFTFVDQPGGDYSITTGDTGAYQHGVDLRTDPTYPITEDISGALRGAITSIGAHDPDTSVPPSLTSPTGTKTGETTATGAVTCDVVGADIWAYVSTSSSPPSVVDHKAGTGAVATDFVDVSVIGVNAFTFTGLTQNTTYYVHYLANDGSFDSDQVTSASFTTDAGLTITSVNAGASIVDGSTAILIQWNQDATTTTAVTINGVAQNNYQTNVGADPTVTSFDFVWPQAAGTKYGASLTLSVDATHNSSVSITPASGYGYVDLSAYDANAEGVITGLPALENGDQIEFETTDAVGNATTVTAQGFPEWTVLDPDSARIFQVRAIDPDDGTRSSFVEVVPPSNVLAGTIQGEATVSGSFGLDIALSGVISGSATITGDLADPLASPLAGVIAGDATVIGNLSAPQALLLSGVISGTSILSGNFQIDTGGLSTLSIAGQLSLVRVIT